MKVILIAVMLIVLTGCSGKKVTYLPCPETIDKIPTVYLHVNKHGGYDRVNRKKADRLIYNLRAVEDYYGGRL